jgi:putative endonuclease
VKIKTLHDMPGNKETGIQGEKMAAAWLTLKGYVVLHTNWRHSHYEIDIVASKDDTLHFIEVKTRNTLMFGQPEESVSKKKLLNLMKAGEVYLETFTQWKKIQYDVVAITLHKQLPPQFFFNEDVYL